uniref:Uncharacterized protein n=1 Tax=Vespula pensylvanica TaxID=30213 RepID=A0A834P692_VESPE|nr:hypothetical protein H0235_006257 [Vespula pensylvanica]
MKRKEDEVTESRKINSQTERANRDRNSLELENSKVEVESDSRGRRRGGEGEEEEEEEEEEEDNEEDVGMVYETPRESTIQSETRGPSVTTAYCSTRVHQSYACKARTVGENGGINCGTF